MSRIYSSSNRINFTDIPEHYSVPRAYHAKQSEVHSAVITYVFDHYKDTNKYRQKVVDALNCLTFCIMQNNPPPFNWVSTDPLDTMPEMDMNEVEHSLGGYFLTADAINWDVSPVSDDTYIKPETISLSTNRDSIPSKLVTSVTQPIQLSSTSVNRPLHQIKDRPKVDSKVNNMAPTPKEDLYIQPPKCPRFDVSQIWISANVGGDNLVIYKTLPEIPTKQNEISITTNSTMMMDSEFIALYPNQVIHTRAPKMYERYDGIKYDDDLGCIIPINGFTEDQVTDNIIRYPHLYRLRKISPDGSISKFFATIEINGQAIPIDEAWDNIPESSIMPRDPEFVKEYVIRRYLLEEDNGVEHRYRMYGSLEPFLTLFMPASKYQERGYSDVLGMAKQCVNSRIHYKQTRSPILKRIETSV